MMMLMSGKSNRERDRERERERATRVLCCVFSFGFGCIFFSRNKEYTIVGANGLRIRTLWKTNFASRKSAEKAKPSQFKTESAPHQIKNRIN